MGEALTDPFVNATTGKLCKGKMAARALAVMILDPKISGYLLAHDPKAYEQAQRALEPFGYPDEEAMREKFGL